MKKLFTIILFILMLLCIGKIKALQLEEGDYYIRSALDNNLVLNISTGTTDNGSNIELYSWNETELQAWHVKPISKNHYYITSKLNNNKSLDVAGGSKKNGANVQLYEYNGSDAQIWELIVANDGYYYIKSKINGLNLDVSGGRKTNGANIQVYENNNSAAQKFKFEKINSNELIEEGDYYIRSALDNNLVLNISTGTTDNGSNIELYSWNETELQAWHVKPISKNHYYITSKLNNNKSLDVAGGSKKNGANVQLYEYNGSDAQIWELIVANDGYYYIKSKINGLNLDVSGGRKTNGANIQVYENNNSAAQKFKFELIKVTETAEGEQVGSLDPILNYNDIDITDGYYIVSSSLNNDLVIDLSNGSKVNGTNIQVSDRTSNLNQVWYIKKQNDGSYSITSALNRNTSFDILNGDLTTKNNIQLYRYNDIDNQKWYIRDTEDGNVTFVSKAGEFAIDLDSLNIGNGFNVVINNLNYSETQKFRLEPYTNTKIYKGIDVSSHNGTINWGDVANEVDFAIIRLGYGGGEDGRDDTNFVDNVRGCEEYNIPYGVYLYSYALNSDIDTTVEIEHARNLLSGINPNLGTKVFFDMEDADNWKRRHGVYDDNVLLNTITDRFCAGVESYGYSCGIYANVDWLTNKLDAVSLANKYTIWVAIWPDNSTINNFSTAYNMRPAYNLTSYNYWQFTSNGYINGINGAVDLNLGYDIFD